MMKLNAPKVITLVISVILFVLGLVAQFAMAGKLLLPALWWMVAGYAVLLLGNLLKGL
ncbi:MAG: hypothetical protein VB108_04545 [Anaerolineaceae bacterium]|nr:hypothetical protein [Anaerolineaceae bacterium]